MIRSMSYSRYLKIATSTLTGSAFVPYPMMRPIVPQAPGKPLNEW